MTRIKYVLTSAAVLLGATLAANAQPQYSPYPYTAYYPYTSAPPGPPAWSYDPYTSGLGPCPQRGRGDPPCADMIDPTYGQPSYWHRH